MSITTNLPFPARVAGGPLADPSQVVVASADQIVRGAGGTAEDAIISGQEQDVALHGRINAAFMLLIDKVGTDDFGQAVTDLQGLIGEAREQDVVLHGRVNEAFELLVEKVGTDAFAGAVTDLQAAIGEKASQASVVATTARTAAAEVRPARVSRPGDALAAYTLSLGDGDPALLPKIDPALAVASARGMVRRHYGATATSVAEYMPMSLTGIVRLTFGIQRIVSAGEPIGLVALYFDVARARHASFGLGIPNSAQTITREDGYREFSYTFSRTAQAGVDFVVPDGVAYLRATLQTAPGEVSLDAVIVAQEDVTLEIKTQTDIAAGVAATADFARAQALRVKLMGESSVLPIASWAPKTWVPEFTTSFTGWGTYQDVFVDDVADGFMQYLSIPAEAVSGDVLVVSRPYANVSDIAPGLQVGDRIHDVSPSLRFAPSKVPAPASHALSEEVSKLDVSFGKPLRREAGWSYAMMVRMRNAAGGLVQVGRVPSDGAGLSSFTKGWVFGQSGVLTKLNGDTTAGYVYRREPEQRKTLPIPQVCGDPIVSGLTVDTRGLTVRDPNGIRPLYGSVHTIAAASTGTNVTKNGVNLSNGGAPVLDHSNVSNVVVKRTGTNTVLVRDVHYHLDNASGKLFGIGGYADTIVDVTYDWAKERIDLIAEVPEYGATIVLAGQERVHSAHEDMFRAKPNNPTQRPLFHVRVVGGRIAEIIPVWDWVGTLSSKNWTEIEAYVGLAKQAISPFIVKLLRGEGVIVSSYGSSLVEMGGGQYNSPADFEPNRYNGSDATDLGGFIGPYYYTPLEADFAPAFFSTVGTIAMNGHTRYKVGPIWRVIDAICATYGYTLIGDAEWNARGSRLPGPREIVYLNQGIGATTMADTDGNMGDMQRLHALLDPSPWGFRTPDLVIMDAGMNGTPDQLFPQHLGHVLDTIQSAKVPVLVYGAQQINVEPTPSIAGRFTIDTWRNIHSQIRTVALAHRVGYMPMDLIQGPGNDGYMGITAVSCCRPNWFQHDGPYEQRKRGDFLALPVLP